MATFGSYKMQTPVNGTPPNAGMAPTNKSLQGAFGGGFGEWFSNIRNNHMARFPGFMDRSKDPQGLQGFMSRFQPQPPAAQPPAPPQEGQPMEPPAPALDISQLPNAGGLVGRNPGRIPAQPGRGGGMNYHYGMPGQTPTNPAPLA